MGYIYLIISIIMVGFADQCEAHGCLWEPPARGTAWRHPAFANMISAGKHNYNDNQLFCGGFDHQWNKYGGKCGICGDPYEGPRDNEVGGRFDPGGLVTGTYTPGATIDIKVEITAHHKGWFEFRYCCDEEVPWKEATESCLNKNLLAQPNGTTRLDITHDIARMYSIPIVLPTETCTRAVLQWKYHTGNSWGVCGDGIGRKGCGPQEEFYGCADITLTGSGGDTQTTTSAATIATATTATAATTATDAPTGAPTVAGGTTCRATGVWIAVPGMDNWCENNCAVGSCSSSDRCVCDGAGGVSTTTTTTTSTTSTTPTSTTTTTTSTTTTTEAPSAGGVRVCRSAGAFNGQPGMDTWCVNNCAAGYCPSTHCVCN